MPADLALRKRTATGRIDLVVSPTGLVLDRSPASAMLFALLGQRRARPDDALPASMPEDPAAPASLNARGGWAGDALDARGDLAGSRLWLLTRAKMPEALQRAPALAAEALAPLSRRGITPTVAAVQTARGGMQLRCSAAGAVVVVPVVTA
jgi:phage gp46-like protein